MNFSWNLFLFVIMILGYVNEINGRIDIDFQYESKTMKKMPRFWTNVGFAPPEPVDKVFEFFSSKDIQLNLEIIGSLPNQGIQNVRIHWLLNLLSVKNYTSQRLPTFDFRKLDEFLVKLVDEYRLMPTIEFMMTQKFQRLNFTTWMDISYQIVSHYIGYYGIKSVEKWKFETWNEPDLRGYNRLNFSNSDFKYYIQGVREGIRAAERLYGLPSRIMLRGPAGLFKDIKRHPFCWGVLNDCNRNPSKCPVDVITFHRKGGGNNAQEILDGSLELLEIFNEKFPNLTSFKFSNTEADPIKKWSEPRDFHADTRYAAILVDTIFEHWQAMYEGTMKNLESLSHDNAFLNFVPHIFTQRTLLARFQMNNTKPHHVQFVQKPVYSALGLVASVGEMASKVREVKGENISFVVTTNEKSFYACIIIWSQVDTRFNYKNKSRKVEILVSKLYGDNMFYFVEGVDRKRTNPSKIYEEHQRPSYPDPSLFKLMRSKENPSILEQPTKVAQGKIVLDFQLMAPFIVSIRICSKDNVQIAKISNLRIRRINKQEIIIFWSQEVLNQNCLKTFEIFFKNSNTSDGFIQLETPHIPFLYHQLRHTIPGCFKIRSRNIFDDFSEFSEQQCRLRDQFVV